MQMKPMAMTLAFVTCAIPAYAEQPTSIVEPLFVLPSKVLGTEDVKARQKLLEHEQEFEQVRAQQKEQLEQIKQQQLQMMGVLQQIIDLTEKMAALQAWQSSSAGKLANVQNSFAKTRDDYDQRLNELEMQLEQAKQRAEGNAGQSSTAAGSK